MRTSSARSVLPLCAVVAAFAVACGSDSTAPRGDGSGTPGIEIVAGAGVTDTIDAVLPQALRVVVRDSSGHVVPGAVVRFSSVPIARPGGTMPSVLVGDVSSLGAYSFLAETTSTGGEALVRLVMGETTGAGGVAISVPQVGMQATASFTITPGAATKVVLPVSDTTVQVGRTVSLAGRVVDRHANARTDSVAYDAPGSGVTISRDVVTGTAPARVEIIGRSGALPRDTTWVSVVPAATIAARRGSKLVTAALDGTGLTEIPLSLDAEDPDPEWNPDGKSLLAVLGTFGGPRVLYQVDLGGAMQRVLDAAAPKTGYVYEASYSPDARWVYFAAGTCNFAAILYRVPAGGSAAVERLSPTGPDECFELVNHWPSVSPDGTRLAFENQTGNQQGFSVRVMDVATQAVTQIVADGRHPRWSPAGDLIAYWSANRIWVVKPDGTGARVVSSAGRSYVPGVQWSPDGQWLLARFSPMQGWAGTTVALINVSTGVEIPLPWTTAYGGVGLPAWKPAP